MSERNDLTRWNRAGLTRFRYVDGKAPEYLEILRRKLVKFFEYDLDLLSVATTDNLVDTGRSLVIVARVDAHLYIRIFDDRGEKVVDKAENELISGQALTALRQRLDPFPDVSSLSQEEKQEIIEDATSSAEHVHRTWLKPAEEIPANEKKPKTEVETLTQRQERLSRKQERILEMYHQDRRDWAWEITRTFARACHILTEHTNAYANEGYLGTATQWDHVRRMVEMLDYHPAPPASAFTWLAFIAKENKPGEKPKTGIVAKGFKVKHSPPTGGEKIIFETLEDLFIDPALNKLRPKGWDQSDKPAVRPDNNRGTQPPAEERQFSSIANGPAIHIQGVGDRRADQLNDLPGYSEINPFKIKDFLSLDPDNSGLDIDATWLWELKTKAEIIIDFAPKGNWSAITEWLLPDIAEESAGSLAELSGNSLEMAGSLKQDIQKIAMCLDQPVFIQAQFKDLFAPVSPAPGTVKTSWHAKRKPKIAADEVVMICREISDENENKYIDKAEAATIASIEKQTEIIHLKPSPVQKTWFDWKKSEVRLKVAPRWQRKCWLNGSNVIRTKEPHGLTVGTFIGWDVNRNRTGAWNYAGITYAEIEKVDKRNIRLKYDGILPEEHTELIKLQPIDGSILSPDYEVIVLLGDENEGGDVADAVEDVAPEISESPFDLIFTIDDSASGGIGGGGFLPPASLPKIGSFLFPSPMLPMDLVKAAVELMLNLGVMQIPSSNKVVIKGLPFKGDLAGQTDMELLAGDLYDMLDRMVSVDSDGNSTEEKLIKWDPSFYDEADPEQRIQNIKDALTELLSKAESEPSALFQEIKEGIVRSGPLLAIPKDPPKKAVVDSIVPRYVVEGSAEKIASGDWMVGQFSEGGTVLKVVKALQVSAINEFTDRDKSYFSLSFENMVGNEGELQNVYADFRGELTPEDAEINEDLVEPEGIELEDVPESLKIGRNVLLTGTGKKPVAAKIEIIDGNTIKTSPSAIDFKKGNLIIYGNVVLAGHGEGRPEKILGSGDASKSNQEFTLEVEDVSFTPDATMSSGVAAAIEVKVAGRVWEQVSTLKDSTPDACHYAIRMTEERYVKFLFGDGEYGRRLPSDQNNVRVRYRVGSGLAGNVPAGSLEKPVNPHRLIKAVRQPLQAAGGGDMEDVASLRENAPSTLLALERAVSLSDFSHLAASQSSVWQAKAYRQILHGGRTESVRVVIVPAGGVTSEDIEKDIENFLQKHALPSVQVIVDDCVKERISLSITVRVKTNEFVAEEVENVVASVLSDHFTLKNRKLGEHLYLSEVYKIVENIQGVENSICVLNSDKTLQLIRADNESTVVYLDTDVGSTLTVTAEEYLP